jgi:hypothetical protein
MEKQTKTLFHYLKVYELAGALVIASTLFLRTGITGMEIFLTILAMLLVLTPAILRFAAPGLLPESKGQTLVNAGITLAVVGLFFLLSRWLQ